MPQMLERAQGGTIRLNQATNVSNVMMKDALSLYDCVADSNYPIRRLSISFSSLASEESEGYDFFTDIESIDRDRKLEKTALKISEKYGKNAILRGVNFLNESTQRERNMLIGGHSAGYDKRGKS